ncbi:Uncharacterised protein [Vibrio cholerae]|nr:Uncharacterised protein [Vibrio cholerae]
MLLFEFENSFGGRVSGLIATSINGLIKVSSELFATIYTASISRRLRGWLSKPIPSRDSICAMFCWLSCKPKMELILRCN